MAGGVDGSGWQMASAHVCSRVKLAEFNVATGHRSRFENLLNDACGAGDNLCEAVRRCEPREKVGIKASRYTAQHNNKENDLHLGVIAVPVAVHVNVEFLPRALRDKAVVDELRAERHVT